MSASRNWPRSQNLFLQPMEMLGYPIDRGGHCLGFSKAVRDFILRRKADVVNKDLEVLINNKPGDIVANIRRVQEEQKKVAVAKRMLKEGKPVNQPIVTPQEKAHREKYLNLLYLFDSFELLQKPYQHPEYFKPEKAPKR